MSESPRLVYTLRADAAPESERAVLPNVFRFILDCHAKKNAAGVTSTNGDDPKGSEHDRAIPSIPDRP